MSQLEDSTNSKTICLYGLPRIGKANLVTALSQALNRPLFEFTLNKFTTVSDIKGVRRMFTGGMPGIIGQVLQKIKSGNPIILIKNIDYFDM